jgi:short-subunit dehydrogenase
MKLLNEVDNLDIGILVNNVGTYLHGPFHMDSAEAIKNLLITNTYPMTYLTRGLLEKFAKRLGQTIFNFL